MLPRAALAQQPVGSSEMTNAMKFFKQIHIIIYIAQFQKVHVDASSTKKTEGFMQRFSGCKTVW